MKLSDAPEFLTLEELQDEIEEYTYRPGWELSVFADPWEGPCLYVKATVENAYQKEPLEIRVRSLIPPIPDAEYFGHWLLWRLIQIENHEAREFLRYGGEPLFDPHDPIEPHPEEKTPKRQGLSPNHAIIGDSFNSLAEWQKSMSQRAQKTAQDLVKGLYGWDPSGGKKSPLANMELMSDGSVKTIAKGTSPGNPFEDQDARTGESTSDDESTPDHEPQFEVRMFSDIENTVSVWDRARSRWATEKTWNRLSSGARQEAERLNSAPAPRYEVRSGNLGDWEIWDKQAGWRIATFHSKDESYANNWVRYLNETEDRGD